MGPITLFDKSFLQSLSLDESVWFDHFFYPVICPLFYMETLADLEKAVRQNRTPEQEVGIIADKTPQFHGGPCVYHLALVEANLHGFPVPMTGQIPVAGGQEVRYGDRRGVVYESSPEAAAFNRWQEGKFLEVERQFAQQWRSSLSSDDLLAIASAMRAMQIDSEKCKSLKEARDLAMNIVDAADNLTERMRFALLLLNIPLSMHQEIMQRWNASGASSIRSYAPYAAHVLGVKLFFQIAMGANLISPERASNQIDVAYLYYLPFCMVFVSSDKLHMRCAPLFLRANQDFAWGPALKESLKQLNDHYLKKTDAEKELGINVFAKCPPGASNCLVSQLWDRHIKPWRNNKLDFSIKDHDKEKEIIEHINKLANAMPISQDAQEEGIDESELLIKRKVRKKKGSWWQLPKNLDANDN